MNAEKVGSEHRLLIWKESVQTDSKKLPNNQGKSKAMVEPANISRQAQFHKESADILSVARCPGTDCSITL